jgi:hypothetical protein
MGHGITRRGFLSALAGSGTAVLLSSCSGHRITVHPGLDIRILNGVILDGTGSPERSVDIGIHDVVIIR